MVSETERLIIIAGVVVIVVLLLQALLRMPRALPQVPPTVAPMVSPVDEDVRALRHWRANADQLMASLTQRLEQQEKQLTVVRNDLGEIKGGMARSERMLELLIENGLKGESA